MNKWMKKKNKGILIGSVISVLSLAIVFYIQFKMKDKEVHVLK